MIYVLAQTFDRLRENQFQKMWGSLYEGISLKSRWHVACNLIFMIRRILFVTMCFNLEEIPGIQLILVNLCNLACFIYYGSKPYETRF